MCGFCFVLFFTALKVDDRGFFSIFTCEEQWTWEFQINKCCRFSQQRIAFK